MAPDAEEPPHAEAPEAPEANDVQDALGEATGIVGEDPGLEESAVVDCYMNEPDAADEVEGGSALFAGSALFGGTEDELGEGLLEALSPQKKQVAAAERGETDEAAEAAEPTQVSEVTEAAELVEKAETAGGDATGDATGDAAGAAGGDAEEPNIDPAEMVDDDPLLPDVEAVAEQATEIVEPVVELSAVTQPLSDVLLIDEDDLIDDIVPIVSYEDKKSQFTKTDRLIRPKNGQFPSIFCALNVVVRLEPLGVSSNLAMTLPDEDVELLLREDFDFGASLVHWEEGSACAAGSSAREIMAALNTDRANGHGAGSSLKLDRWGVVATIIEVTETGEDVDPARITALAHDLKAAPDADSVVFELPQVWVIPDRDFKAKTGSIGLYPGSYWMGFMKSWGHVTTAEIFFRTVKKVGPEPFVHLLVQFQDREHLKMCFAFLYERYLAHPKKECGLRQPHCKLVSFAKFKGQSRISAPKAAFKPGVKAKAKPGAKLALGGKGIPAPKMKVVKGIRYDGSLEYGDAGSGQKPLLKSPLKPQSKALPLKRAPDTPMPRPSIIEVPPSSPPRQQMSVAAEVAPTVAPDASAGFPADDDSDRALTPAEAMHGLSGKHLEAFQMVMTRMERLERENQELMQILLQMQNLLQQQQQRNARLTQAAGYAASGDQGAGLQPGAAHGHTLLPGQLPMPQPLPPQFGLSSLPRGPVLGRPSEPPGLPAMPTMPAMPAMPVMLAPPPQLQLRPPVAPMQAPLAVNPCGVKRSAEQMHYQAAPPMQHLAPQTPGAPAPGASAAGKPADAAPWKSLRKRQRRDSSGKSAPGEESSAAVVDVVGAPQQAPAAPQDAMAALAAYNNALLG